MQTRLVAARTVVKGSLESVAARIVVKGSLDSSLHLSKRRFGQRWI